MGKLVGMVALAALWLSPAAALAEAGLTGVWEIASFNADRRVEVWQEGDRFTAYRVMHPEFEGERYKLEHLFIGKIDGGAISGKLYVREEGMADFELLRSFIGSVKSPVKIMIDGLPADKQDEVLETKPPPRKKKKRRIRPLPKTSFSLPAGVHQRRPAGQEVS